jgi:hypothetical protein
MSKQNIAKGAGVLAAGYLVFRALGRSTKPKKTPTMILPGQTAHVYMGGMATVRLPRGRYELYKGDGLIVLAAQRDVGHHTNVTIAIGGSGDGYTIEPVFVDVEHPDRSFPVTLIVRRFDV